MTLPTIVFCHGAWHNVRFFDKVIARLEPLGYKCITAALPSASGRNPPTTSLDEDIAAIRNAVVKELDAGNNVVMNAHSWGGIPMGSALEGLTMPERLKAGKTNGVTKLTWCTAFVFPEDTSVKSFTNGPLPTWEINEAGDALNHAGDLRDVFYHDVDEKEADEWLAILRPQSLASFTAKTTSAAWKKIPSAYMICEDDHAIPAALQEMMSGSIKEAGMDLEITRIPGSHSPYLAQPDAVVDFLRKAIEEPQS